MEPEPAAGPVSHVVGGRGSEGVSAASAAAAAAARRQAVLAAERAAAMAAVQPGSQVDVTRAYEQPADQQTRAEEAALAAWGGLATRSSATSEAHASLGSPPAGGEVPVESNQVDDAPSAERLSGGCAVRDDGMAAGSSADAGPGRSGHAAEGADADGDSRMRGAEDTPHMPSEAVHEMVQSIGEVLRRRQHDGGAVVALQTVQQILRNAAEKEEPKYRRIRRQNELYAVRVAPFPEAEALLTVAGFQLQDDVWTLPAQHSPRTLARVHEEVAQVLQSCQ